MITVKTQIKPNKNGYAYDKTTLNNAITNYLNTIDNRFGELEPADKSRITINLGEVSHKITDIKLDEQTESYEITADILDTPKGKMVQEMLNAKIFGDFSTTPGFTITPRAIGQIDENKIIKIDSIVSFDIERS